MSIMNKEELHKLNRENKLILEAEFKELSLKRKEDKKALKKSRKEFAILEKEDKPNLKKYKKEIKLFEKNGKKDCSERIKDVKEWYSKINKTSSNKKVYKYKMQRAKNVAYNYSGDIKFENVSYIYSKNTPFEFTALKGTDITIDEGKITAVIGTTGSGKSTLIQLANGLITSETGRAIIGDFQIPGKTKKISQIKPLRKEIGLVFQFPEYQLFQDTIEKDISFGPLNMGISKEEIEQKIPDLLDMVSLPRDYAKRSPFALSGGQKRRVAIAGIIAMDGNTLVLDEPTGGLDPQGEEDFMNLFMSLNKEKGKRIIIVTHNMDHVLKIADQVVVMSNGKVERKGTPFEIFSDEELLNKIQIEPPKLYQLAHKLKEKGLDITDKEFRNIDEFAQAIKKKRGK